MTAQKCGQSTSSITYPSPLKTQRNTSTQDHERQTMYTIVQQINRLSGISIAQQDRQSRALGQTQLTKVTTPHGRGLPHN